MKNNLILILVAILILAGLALWSYKMSQQSKFTDLEIRLSLEVSRSRVMATITYINKGDYELSILEIPGALYNELREDVFEIKSNDQRLSYIGKRKMPPQGAKFIKSETSLSTSVRIDDSYQFLPGSHTYTIKYIGRPVDLRNIISHQKDQISIDDLNLLFPLIESNEVRFDFRK